MNIVSLQQCSTRKELLHCYYTACCPIHTNAHYMPALSRPITSIDRFLRSRKKEGAAIVSSLTCLRFKDSLAHTCVDPQAHGPPAVPNGYIFFWPKCVRMVRNCAACGTIVFRNRHFGRTDTSRRRENAQEGQQDSKRREGRRGRSERSKVLLHTEREGIVSFGWARSKVKVLKAAVRRPG